MDTSYLFKKPTFLTNMYELFPSFPRKKEDRGIFKKIFDKKKGEYINIKQFAELGIAYHHCEIDMNDLNFIENTSEELLEGISEYYDLISSNENKFINSQNSKIQNNFNTFLSNRLQEMYENDFIKNDYFKKNDWKKNEFMRITKRFKSCEGTLTKSYLKYNF